MTTPFAAARTPGAAPALPLPPADDETATAGDPWEAFGAELDELRRQVLDSLGEEDARYIRRLIRLQRSLDLGGRLALLAGVFPPAWLAGVGMLSLAKILDNMEIGHNVLHGQYDWMRDPTIHSTTWEWDIVCPAAQWKHSHNEMHHQWTNVRGKDRDVGYGVLRMDPEEPWTRLAAFQPLSFVTLAVLFEWGIGIHDVDLGFTDDGPLDWERGKPKLVELGAKARKQVTKDYLLFPLLSAPFGLPGMVAAFTGALTANVVRNLWAFAVIFCGHFPDGAEIFDPDEVQDETRGQWYRRQALGSANFDGGPLMHLLTGNLDHQIEHHLFPDIPSRRYAHIAPKVRDICRRHGVRYNTGPMAKQFGRVIRKTIALSFRDARR